MLLWLTLASRRVEWQGRLLGIRILGVPKGFFTWEPHRAISSTGNPQTQVSIPFMKLTAYARTLH